MFAAARWCDGKMRKPLSREAMMSFVHFNPDIREIPCVGCGLLVTKEFLIKDHQHPGASVPLWHPYHLWCVRTVGGAAAPWSHCAACHQPVDEDEVLDAHFWLMRRMSSSGFKGDGTTPHLAWRRVRVLASALRYRPLLSELGSPKDEGMFEHLLPYFEVVHRACLIPLDAHEPPALLGREDSPEPPFSPEELAARLWHFSALGDVHAARELFRDMTRRQDREGLCRLGQLIGTTLPDLGREILHAWLAWEPATQWTALRSVLRWQAEPNNPLFTVKPFRVSLLWDEARARLFACDCAERVLHLFERAFPDDQSPRQALACARSFATGQCDEAALEPFSGMQTNPIDNASARSAYVAAISTTYVSRNDPWFTASHAQEAVEKSVEKHQAHTAKAAERDWQAERLVQYYLGLC